jgi:nucleotide-binding universal stress UspA family protein
MYSRILVALDGSKYSRWGGDIALSLARKTGSEIVASHIYDAGIHSSRFREMEPALPPRYEEEGSIDRLRESHKELIAHGLKSLSKGYVEQFVKRAERQKVQISQIEVEGRNYIKILHLAREEKIDLVVLGAYGLANIGNGVMGSTALRVLRLASCDVLIVRSDSMKGSVLVGIDGSDESLAALRKGISWAKIFGNSLCLAAVYDPFFHTQVFKNMSRSFSPERREEIGLSKQETLHDQIIDDGLGKLYRNFLDRAEELCRGSKIEAKANLLKGKPYRGITDHAKLEGADLVVVGRFGHHREDSARIGSNCEAVSRLNGTNVLITTPGADSQGADGQEKLKKPVEEKSRSIPEASPITWEEDALTRLQHIPAFARSMARAGIEEYVRLKGSDRVTLKDFEEVARNMGMGI